jgi:hypothetical protein
MLGAKQSSKILSVGVWAAVCLWSGQVALGADASSPDASPSPVSVRLDVTKDDMQTLFKALEVELTPHSGTIYVEIVPKSKMPAYDPLTHYAGIGADNYTGHPVVLASQASMKDPAMQDAIGAAFSLAVMDSGEAGPKWKSIYDAAAAADNALPASAPDPYFYRHELAAQVRPLEKPSH